MENNRKSEVFFQKIEEMLWKFCVLEILSR
jgi:hypothetical protein